MESSRHTFAHRCDLSHQRGLTGYPASLRKAPQILARRNAVRLLITLGLEGVLQGAPLDISAADICQGFSIDQAQFADA